MLEDRKLNKNMNNIDDNIKEYLMYVEDTLMSKYNISQDLSRKIISESYLPDSITMYPEECLHEDIEITADIIYHDYLEGV